MADQQRIDNPTTAQIGHSLRNLPPDAPFVILNADDEQFIQAMPAGKAYRVEWRQESEQRFMIVSIDRAEEAFAAFGRWDERALQSLPWRRLTLFNDPYRRLVLIVAVAALLLLTLSLLRILWAVR